MPPTSSEAERVRIYQHDFDRHGQPNPAALRVAHVPPPWRSFGRTVPLLEESTPSPTARPMSDEQELRGRQYLAFREEAQLVDAALVLRRPLLITGQAGLGKTTLAYSVAWQLGLGNVLRWGITSRSTLKDGLYQYDVLARLHDTNLNKNPTDQKALDFGNYFTLGPLGTALLPTEAKTYFPRVLLIDEIDKSDADLPSDLLHVLEEGRFHIPEIERLPEALKQDGVYVYSGDQQTDDTPKPKVKIPKNGVVKCDDFPLIIMTSNSDRDFPPAFLRRCLILSIPWERREQQLEQIVQQHLGVIPSTDAKLKGILDEFKKRRAAPDAALAIDQLLNALHLARSGADVDPSKHRAVLEVVFRSLFDSPQPGGQ